MSEVSSQKRDSVLGLPCDVGVNPTTAHAGIIVIDAAGVSWLVPFVSDGWERRTRLKSRPYLATADAAQLLRTLAGLCGVPNSDTLHVW